VQLWRVGTVDAKTLNGAIQEAHRFGQALLANPDLDVYGRYRASLVNVQFKLQEAGQPVQDIAETVKIVNLVMTEGKL
jgi:hypothetical protein